MKKNKIKERAANKKQILCLPETEFVADIWSRDDTLVTIALSMFKPWLSGSVHTAERGVKLEPT